MIQHCTDIEQTAFEMAERVREQSHEQYPAPDEGIERIQVFEHAQMVAYELLISF